MIAFFARNLPHFVSHAAPIFHALDPKYRGNFFARGRAAARCVELGIEPTWPPSRFSQQHIVLVASYEDYRSVRPAKVIFLNHGAGQVYYGANSEIHPAYSGGEDRDRTILFLEPSERVADISRAAYPNIPAVVIGPPPYLDRFIRKPPTPEPGLIAISFHADAGTADEARSAFPHYRQAVSDFARSGRYKLLGHAHPRRHSEMQMFWGALGVEYEPSWERVLERASVYVVDNSSTGFEFAALDHPVVFLDAPWYQIAHGLRFFEFADIGVRISSPDDLQSGVDLALSDPPEIRERRRQQARDVYSGCVDGNSTQRAIEAILEVTDG